MKHIITTLLLLLISVAADAQKAEIDGIYYNLSPKTKTAEVTSSPKHYSGELTIPGIIAYDGVKYRVTGIGTKAFVSNFGLTSVHLPEGLATIGESAFAYCRIDSIIVPNSIDSIGDFAFAYCPNLRKAVLGKNLTTLGNGVFVSCENLVDAVVPDRVVSLGVGVFNQCKKLLSATLGQRVETIGAQCFANCVSLRYFYSYADLVPKAHETAFEHVKISKVMLFVPMFSVKQYEKREPWGYFKSVKPMKE